MTLKKWLGDLVLDNAAGSFSLAEAAINTNRNYICIEKEPKYYEKGLERIENAKNRMLG